MIGTIGFRTASIIRKRWDGILFSYLIVEVPAASLEKIKEVSLFFFIIMFLVNVGMSWSDNKVKSIVLGYFLACLFWDIIVLASLITS